MKKYKELILYLLFGLLTTVVNLVVFKCFEKLTHVLIVNIIAWVAAVTFAFFTNKLFVFKSKSWKGSVVVKEAVSFTGARIFSLGVEELGIFLMITVLKLTPALGRFAVWCLDLTKLVNITMPAAFYEKLDGTMMVKLILSLFVVILNYIFSKLIIFKNKGNAREE